jgi:hypothetical protein
MYGNEMAVHRQTQEHKEQIKVYPAPPTPLPVSLPSQPQHLISKMLNSLKSQDNEDPASSKDEGHKEEKCTENSDVTCAENLSAYDSSLSSLSSYSTTAMSDNGEDTSNSSLSSFQLNASNSSFGNFFESSMFRSFHMSNSNLSLATDYNGKSGDNIPLQYFANISLPSLESLVGSRSFSKLTDSSFFNQSFHIQGNNDKPVSQNNGANNGANT